MKVLHVSYSDHEGAGGAGVAMYRLHRGLIKAGVDSRILSRMKSLKSDESTTIPRSVTELSLRKITTALGLNGLEGVGSFGIKRRPRYRDADILNLHCIHSGYFNYLALPSLTKDKPTVWSHHDLWAITGHCSYSYDCTRWKTGCGKCPYPDHYPPIQRDATALEWKLKNWAYQHSKLHVVVASQWFFDRMKESILQRFPIHRIPWGLDTAVFKPINKEQCRFVLGIPQNKKVLMFGAVNANLHNKGGDLLIKAIEKLPESLKKNLVFLTIGHRGGDVFAKVGVPSIHLGYVLQDTFKAVAYSAADLYVLPTRAETFSLIVIESMACGVPVVSFAVGPIPELVKNGQTGYVAQPENPDDLAKGIAQLLEDNALRESLGAKCRAVVEREYTVELQIKRYLDLYRSISN